MYGLRFRVKIIKIVNKILCCVKIVEDIEIETIEEFLALEKEINIY